MTGKKKIILTGLIVALGTSFIWSYNAKQEEKIANLEKTIDNQSNEVYNRDIMIQELNRKLIEQQKVINDLEWTKNRLETQEVSRGGGRQLQVRVTHYSADETGSAMTASGKEGTPYRTLAFNGLPLGTHVSINGQEYVIEDRCGLDNVADIFVTSSDEAVSLGTYYATMEVLD